MNNSRLIARFMGIKPTMVAPDSYTLSFSPWISVNSPTPEKCWEELGDSLDKKYKTSWDWLMPLVGKCYYIDYEADDVEMSNLVGDISCAVLNIDIQETYEACVELIKYVNSKG